jgi:S1-C subfamily serine protease
MRISGTTPGSPAAAAGLKEGDVITQIGDDKIATVYDLTDFLKKAKPGEKVKITVLRDGKTVDAEATLTARKG